MSKQLNKLKPRRKHTTQKNLFFHR